MMQWDHQRNKSLPTLNAGKSNIERHVHMSNFQKSYLVLDLESRIKMLEAKTQSHVR